MSFFFFKQKTAYELRISDWSSDVCSSDLMEAAIAFLGSVFSADPGHGHPAIVSVDEAHLFAPHGDNGVSRETRKASLETMRDLMCRGRKRGLAGIIATQRLSKLDKNVAAEASNFLTIGRAQCRTRG